ncbi:MAG: magnesium transporter [Armatimonadota bacterium]
MQEEHRLLTETVEELVREGAVTDLRRVLEEQPPEDLADLLEHANDEVREVVFDALRPQLAGEVATLLDETVRDELLEDLESERLAEMVSDLDSEEAVVLLEDTDPAVADDVLRRIDPDEAQELRELLGYDDESAGRAMAFGAPAVRPEMTLEEAIASLRERADELDEVQEVWVVDAAGRLQGYLPLDVLLLQRPQLAVSEVMRRDVEFAYTYEDQEQASIRAQRSHLLALPIIDSRGVLRGQITHARLREIAEEESSEDMYRMVGLSEDESVYSSFGFSLRKRLPWLYVNLGTAFLAAWVISFFEGTIERVAALAALQTIVAGQGGNAGIQTLTIIVRGLALGELDWRNARRTFVKELALGAANGCAVGTLVGAAVWLWRGNPWMGLVIAAAMLLNMIAAALAGFGVPLALRKLKLDPAQASGVFVTTVTDVCGFLFFLGLATLMLPLLR